MSRVKSAWFGGLIGLVVVGTSMTVTHTIETHERHSQRQQAALEQSIADAETANDDLSVSLDEAKALVADADTVLQQMEANGLDAGDEYAALEREEASLRVAQETTHIVTPSTSADGTATNVTAAGAVTHGVDALRAKIKGAQAALATAKEALRVFDMADEKAAYDAVVTAGASTIDGATATLSTTDGQVTDPATRETLQAALDTLKSQSTKTPTLLSAAWYEAQAARITDADVATQSAIDAVNASHAAWQQAQGVPVTPPVSAGSHKPSTGGGSTGGSTGGATSGGSTGGSTPPPATPPAPPAPGIISYTACDGQGKYEMLDGVLTGSNVSCAIASQVQAELVNTNQTETCSWYGSETSDSKGYLVSGARGYPSAKFVASQVDDRYVKMDIYTCLKA